MLSWEVGDLRASLPTVPPTDIRIIDHVALQEAWRTLTPREQDVITATIIEGQSQVSVAHRLGVSSPRIHQIQARALARLRDALTEDRS